MRRSNRPPPPAPPAPTRLNRYLARTGLAESRRKADELIAAGRVFVDGVVATLGTTVPPGARISIDGRASDAASPTLVYLAIHKPRGLLSAVRDPENRMTVVDLVRSALGTLPVGLVPVGRLDRSSRGLLLLTNDGAWMQRILHPSGGIVRVYEVALDRPLLEADRARLARGVALEEGISRFDVRRSGPGKYEVRLTRGWKREIRRAFEAAGYVVRDLCRTAFGGIRLGSRTPGSVWTIRPEDALRVREGVGRGAAARGARVRRTASPGSRSRRSSPRGPSGSGRS